MGCLRCSGCGTRWPADYEAFLECPECERRTWWLAGLPEMSMGEARSRKNHADFDRWLDEHDRRTEQELLERAVNIPSLRSRGRID